MPKPGDTSMLNLASNPQLPRVLGPSVEGQVGATRSPDGPPAPAPRPASSCCTSRFRRPRTDCCGRSGRGSGTLRRHTAAQRVRQDAADELSRRQHGQGACLGRRRGITPEEIPAYIAGLSDVVLQADTRVTNHGFLDGQANPIDEVLQAGTAVLVDAYGIPRARCYCGNPLTPPGRRRARRGSRGLAGPASRCRRRWSFSGSPRSPSSR